METAGSVILYFRLCIKTGFQPAAGEPYTLPLPLHPLSGLNVIGVIWNCCANRGTIYEVAVLLGTLCSGESRILVVLLGCFPRGYSADSGTTSLTITLLVS
jgi:hypothetical protein